MVMKIQWFVFPAIVMTLLESFPLRAAETAATNEYLRLRLVRIFDSQLTGHPLEAARLLVPSDWKAEGGVLWTGDPGCPRNAIQPGFKAQSPDGKFGFEMFPYYFWYWSDDHQVRHAAQQAMASLGVKGCDYLPPYDATGYLLQIFLPKWRPGAGLIGIGHVPELAEALQLEYNAMIPATAGTALSEFDVAMAAIEIPSDKGVEEEWVLASVMRTTTVLPALSSIYTGVNRRVGQYANFSFNLFAARAPIGQLEKHENLFNVIYRSFQLNPIWEDGVIQHLKIIDQIEQKGIRDRARIMQDAQQQISAMIEKGQIAREVSQDLAAKKQIRALRGLESYLDPATGSRVELSSGFQGAWTNGLGEYVLSNSPGFNPAGLEGSWYPLRPEDR